MVCWGGGLDNGLREAAPLESEMKNKVLKMGMIVQIKRQNHVIMLATGTKIPLPSNDSNILSYKEWCSNVRNSYKRKKPHK